MRAYDRTQYKRLTDFEARQALAEREGIRPAPRTRRRGMRPFWARFAGVLEDAVEGETGAAAEMRRLARCGRFRAERVFDCGSSEEPVSGWCGHAYCPACSYERAAAASRAARSEWPERLFVAQVEVGKDAPLALPSKASTASVRALWGKATKRAAEVTGLPRLDPMPRVVLAPGAITFFAPLPWSPEGDERMQSAAGDALGAAIREAAAEVGLKRVTAKVRSRESAALTLRECFSREAARFGERVAKDIGRFDELGWRKQFPGDASLEASLRSAARRWMDELEERYGSRRRASVLGGKRALPVEHTPFETSDRVRCPGHGTMCGVEKTVVRDSARGGSVVAQLEGDAVGAALRSAGRKAAIETFLEQAETPRPTLKLHVPTALRRVA